MTGTSLSSSVIGHRHLAAAGHRLAGQDVALVEVLLLEHLVVRQVDLTAEQPQRARAAMPLPARERRGEPRPADPLPQPPARPPPPPAGVAPRPPPAGGGPGR